MQAEIITIGDEILIGQVVDTNSAWMGQQLNLIGIDVLRISSISDTKEAITDALDALYPETKLVLITGGLGPTKDDVTKNTLCDYYNMKLIYQPEIYAHIEKLFAALDRVPAAANKEQAMLPDGCRILPNYMGTAAGMLFNKNERLIVSMPGVPYEMKHIMEEQVLPIAIKELIRQHIVHKTVLTVGVPESELAERISYFENGLPIHIKLAYLPRPGMVRLRLSARGKDKESIERDLAEKVSLLQTILGDVVYGTDTETLEQIIGGLLNIKKHTLSTAESCTGGYIAHKITSVSGSSAYFLGSVVAYANEVKISSLQVDKQVLESNGAVSEQVVKQMAEGARKNFNSTWALATSGIAGPDGGTKEKPVGTVWIALAGPTITAAKKFQFGTHRDRNIKKSAFAALDMLRAALIKS